MKAAYFEAVNQSIKLLRERMVQDQRELARLEFLVQEMEREYKAAAPAPRKPDGRRKPWSKERREAAAAKWTPERREAASRRMRKVWTQVEDRR